VPLQRAEQERSSWMPRCAATLIRCAGGGWRLLHWGAVTLTMGDWEMDIPGDYLPCPTLMMSNASQGCVQAPQIREMIRISQLIAPSLPHAPWLVWCWGGYTLGTSLGMPPDSSGNQLYHHHTPYEVCTYIHHNADSVSFHIPSCCGHHHNDNNDNNEQ
jgi:hypothetical protein